MDPRTLATRILACWAIVGAHALQAQDAPGAPESAEAPEAPAVEARVSQPQPSSSRSGPAGPTRLFLAPTARSFPRGRGSLDLTEAVFPWIEVGLTDRVSVGGLTVVPLDGLTGSAFALMPKVQALGRPRVQAAVGGILGLEGGLGYGVVTLGGADAGLTVGYGYGYGGDGESQGSRSMVFVGAEKAIGRSFRLIAEAYIGGAGLGLPDSTLIGGARVSRGRWSLDLAILIPIYETGGGLPVPVFTIGWAF